MSRNSQRMYWCLCAGMLLLPVGGVAVAQTKDTNATLSTSDRPSGGRIIQAESITGSGASPIGSDSVVARPEVQERFLAPELREQVRKFNAARERYLKEQEELRRQLKGSTEQERKIIRDRIKEIHDRWVAQARAFRDEARERQKELRRALPKHRDALNEVRPGQRGRQPAGLD